MDSTERAVRETTRLLSQARATKRALRQFQDERPRVLGTYVLGAGEQLDGEVMDLLRLAVSSSQQEVEITVTARSGIDKRSST